MNRGTIPSGFLINILLIGVPTSDFGVQLKSIQVTTLIHIFSLHPRTYCAEDSSQSLPNIMADIELRRTYRLISKKLQRQITATEREKFFQSCLKNKVVPQTLQVKAPAGSPSTNQTTQNLYKNAAISSSIKNLTIAIKDARVDKIKENVEFSSFVKDLVDEGKIEKNVIDNYIHSRKPQITRQVSHTFSQKLNHLKKKNDPDFDNPFVAQGTPKSENDLRESDIANNNSTKNNRSFLKRTKHRRWKTKELKKRLPNLVHNFSDFQLDEDMVALLNKGANFAVTPKNINKSQMKANHDRYSRTMQWAEHHYLKEMNGNESEEDSIQDDVPDIFRVKKTNLPPQAPSPLLADYLGATWSELSAATTQKKWYSNTPKEQLVAMGELKKAQQEGHITIKQADKGGGWVILNQTDYIQEMEGQLKAQFQQTDGSMVPFYSKSNANELAQKKTELTRLIEMGNNQGFISDSDAKEMTPNGKAARLYDQPKVHKTIPEGKRIPPLPPNM